MAEATLHGPEPEALTAYSLLPCTGRQTTQAPEYEYPVFCTDCQHRVDLEGQAYLAQKWAGRGEGRA